MLAAAHLGDVEPYQQIAKYSCGAATLRSVLKHWGETVSERTLIREIGIDPEQGSTALQVAGAARQRGYQAQVKQFGSLEELSAYTNRNVPVIVAMRSFTKPNQGHFLVATKVGTHIDLMDPNVKGNKRTLSRREMLSRWAFRDRVGVIVTPKSKTAQLGEVTKKTITYAIVGVVLAIAAATTGVVLWRRKRAS
jgi:ABC-type bacteriocin/lantibiotic exporter with double-glycine peptidase domain